MKGKELEDGTHKSIMSNALSYFQKHKVDLNIRWFETSDEIAQKKY
jgi:hypothetical protein